MCVLHTPITDLPTETNTVLTLDLVIETLNFLQIVSTDNRDGFGRVRGDPCTVYEPSCLWCDKKGHTLIDCTGPAPNSVSKLARDEVLAVRVSLESRNDNRQTCRPASVGTSVCTQSVSVMTRLTTRPPSRGFRPFLNQPSLQCQATYYSILYC